MAADSRGPGGMTSVKRRHLVWFRADLRTIDNTALDAACREPGIEVGAVYIVTPGQWAAHDKAGVQVDFELRTLRGLSARLAALGIPLFLLESRDFTTLPDDLLALCRRHGFQAVYWNRQYEWNERLRDDTVSNALGAAGISVSAHDDQCLATPGTVLTNDGRHYTVFTPFKKSWMQLLVNKHIDVCKEPDKRHELWHAPDPVPDQVRGFASHVEPRLAESLWPAGQEAALERLAVFVEGSLRRYKEWRDFPGQDDGTSRLSPYLAIGAVSPRQCWHAAQNELFAHGPSDQADQWISELCWREFYKHLMVGFPRVCRYQPFRPETRALAWRDAPEDFQRWCEGRTGFPIVDAGMRQLLKTGWMHNRLRMIVSMFLVKDLFIDWRLGERHFMMHLIDGDLAANNGGWQWSASTGNDAAPYFRIFNPLLQSRKFDPEGNFIRSMVPELAGVGGDLIHEPHAKGFRPALGYPAPMVDHKAACARTVAQFQSLRQMPIGRAEG